METISSAPHLYDMLDYFENKSIISSYVTVNFIMLFFFFSSCYLLCVEEERKNSEPILNNNVWFHCFSAFWLRSSVLSVLISLIMSVSMCYLEMMILFFLRRVYLVLWSFWIHFIKILAAPSSPVPFPSIFLFCMRYTDFKLSCLFINYFRVYYEACMHCMGNNMYMAPKHRYKHFNISWIFHLVLAYMRVVT